MTRRLTTVCAGLLLLLLALPAAVQAQYIYTTDDGTITLTGYTGTGGVVNIPSTIDGLPVTRIGWEAFFGQSSLTSVTIPNTVTSIGFSAFAFCDGLTNVTIPNGVTDIDVVAFIDCVSLTSVTIPNSVTRIGDRAFLGCANLAAFTVDPLNSSFSSVDGVLFDESQTRLLIYPGGKTGSYTIPNGVTGIDYDAFASCINLTSVTIPNSVMYGVLFPDCSNLTAITVEPLNSSFSSVDGVLFDKSQTKLIQCPRGKAGSYMIPDGVTSIGWGALSDCSGLTKVTIPNSVTNLESYAFHSCTSLTSVMIPHSVTRIGDGAFLGCAGLTSLTVPSSVTSMGNNPFASCTSLTEITVDALNPNFSSVNGVLLDKSQITLIQYPGGKAGNYTIPSSVTQIGDSSFANCTSLTTVTIPNTVTHIGNGAFASCTALTNVNIAQSVTNIGRIAFVGCASLTAITVEAFNSSFSSVDGVLFDKSQTTLIRYPGGKAGSYTIPDSVTEIGESSFRICTSLTSVTIPNTVTHIGDGAFGYCTALTNVNIAQSVTSIGNSAFDLCTSLTNVTIPASVTNMGQNAFYYCTNLTGVYFAGNSPSTEFSVFRNANNAIAYYLPGTTGWGASFGSRPAVLWNPQVQTSDSSFGVQSNQFGFTITGTSNLVIVVEACTNLDNPVWTALRTTTLAGGSSYFSDPQWTNYPTRLYRLRSP